MDLNLYFDPVSLPKPNHQILPDGELLSHNIYIHTPSREIANILKYQVAILGIREISEEDTGEDLFAADKVRENLYQLQFTKIKGYNIIDLGNLKTGKTSGDSIHALQDVIGFLSATGIIMIIMGGSQQLTLPIFKSMEKPLLNLAIADQRIDLWSDTKEVNAQNYLSEILLMKDKLFNYSSIGHQVCLSSLKETEKKVADHHEFFRLGEIREELRVAEPAIRDSDFLSIDISVVKQVEAPAGAFQTPNGIRSEELCQLTWFAGFGERTSCIGFFEFLPNNDINQLTSNLLAQGIWYFLDGIRARKDEAPPAKNNNMRQFLIELDEEGNKMTFYKSLDTERWWVEIPPEEKSQPPLVVACSYQDYKNASNRIIPSRWFRFFRKFD